uniref:Serpentine receptor class gamma n=1 Tax=Panagrolaimus davidi TaxID=227884 RepID=A0A914P7W5_9BILA
MNNHEKFTEETEEHLESIHWLLVTIDICIDVVFYSGAVFTLFLTICLLYNFSKPNNILSTAYYYVLVLGYAVDLCSVITYILDASVFPEISPMKEINNIIQWYAKLFVGFWNTLLVLNRLTALIWWNKHSKIWEGKFFVGIVLILFVYPFILNGYSFGNPCQLDIDDDECTEYMAESQNFAAIANGVNGVLSLIVGLFTAFAARFSVLASKSSQKYEKQLLIQSIISSFLFGSYCALTAAYSILYPYQNDKDFAVLFDLTRDFSNLFYKIFYYSSAVLLVILS